MSHKRYARGAFYPQVLLLGVIVNFILFTPSPSIAIDVLGVAAVVLAIRATAETFSKTEQVLWILIAVVLCAIEIHAVNKDQSEREAQEDARRWQDDFNRKQEHRQFQTMIDSGRKLLGEQRSSSRETLNQLTGGDTWAWIEALPYTDTRGLSLVVNTVGRYTLRGVRIVTLDNTHRELLPTTAMGDIPGNTGFPAPRSADLNPPPGSHASYNFVISADNGSVTEVLNLDDTPSGWMQTGTVYRTLKSGKRVVAKSFRYGGQ